MIPGTVHVPCIQYPGLNLWRGPVAIGSFSGGVWGFAHLLQPVSVWIVPRPSGCKLASRPTALLSGARPWQPQFSTFQKQRIGTGRRPNRYKPWKSDLLQNPTLGVRKPLGKGLSRRAPFKPGKAVTGLSRRGEKCDFACLSRAVRTQSILV